VRVCSAERWTMGSSGGSTSTPRSDDCSRCSQRTSHCSPNQVNAHTTELLDSGRSSAKRIALTSQTGIRPASSLLLPPHLFLSLSVPQLHTYCSIHLISIPRTRHAPLNPRFCSSPHLQFVPSFSLPLSLCPLLTYSQRSHPVSTSDKRRQMHPTSLP
jgi:hypothetical protein